MAYANLAEAVKSSAFETLSPEAKQHVFDTYSAKDEAYQALSPEAKAHVQQTYLGKAAEPVGEKTPAGAQPSPGMTPVAETGGGAALMAPTSRRRDVPVAEQTFGQDPSKMGKVPLQEYKENVLKSAGIGAAIGAGVGAFTGPGALATGTAGLVLGAASGLAETVAKDLGYGKGVQVLAGTAAGAKLPTDAISTGYKAILGSSVENFIAKKLAFKAGAATGLPGGGYAAQNLFGKAKEALFPARVDSEAAQKLFGEMEHINPATGEVTPVMAQAVAGKSGQTVNLTKATEELAAAHPDAVVPGKPISHGLYEQAKQSYDSIGKQGVNFLDSSEFRGLTGGNAAQETKFAQLFKNEKGQPVVGQDVIENLKNATTKMSYQDAEKVREAFNKYLVSTTGKPTEKIARQAFEKESIAIAKDSLPGSFAANNGKEIKAQLWNLSKVPDGMKAFNQELLAYLEKAPVKDAQRLWNDVGPELQKRFGISPEKYATMTDIMNGAQTPKELSQVRRLLMKVSIPTVATPDQQQ